MRLSIVLSALLTTGLVAGFVTASTEKASAAVVYCQYVDYPVGCVVRPGVALRVRPVARAVVPARRAGNADESRRPGQSRRQALIGSAMYRSPGAARIDVARVIVQREGGLRIQASRVGGGHHETMAWAVVGAVPDGAVGDSGNAQPSATASVVLPTDRTVLPIPEPKYPHSTVLDARNATPPPRFEVKAPAGAPNVLIVLIDDMGFGQSSAFGGPIHMPTVERAGEGGPALQPVPHDGALLADPRGAADRPQSSHEQHGLDHGDRHRVSRPDRTATQQRRAAGRDAAAQRLQHGRVSASPRDARPGKSAPPARPTAGRRARASTSSTASSAAKRTSGRR